MAGSQSKAWNQTMTSSVLDQMTQGILGPKATKATKLTPVKGEETTTVAEMAAALVIPKDVPDAFLAREGMAMAAKDLRRYAADLLKVADGLDVLLGVPEAVEAFDEKKAATEQKLKEQAADRLAADRAKAASGDKKAEKRVTEQEAFDAAMAQKIVAAQAAVFTAADDGGTDEPVALWTCPTHGNADIHNLTATKSGRKYRACGSCSEYEPAPAKVG